MSNRLTKGVGRVGSLACDTSGSIQFDSARAKYKIRVLSFAVTSTAEADTSFDLPANGVVHDIWGKVTTASSAAGTLAIGLLSSSSGGDADGFWVNVGTSSTGDVYATYTASTSGVITGNTRGTFFSTHATGSTEDPGGMYATKPHLCSSVTAKSVTYTGSSTGTGASGLLYIEYTEI